jgi:hypothetical protein
MTVKACAAQGLRACFEQHSELLISTKQQHSRTKLSIESLSLLALTSLTPNGRTDRRAGRLLSVDTSL